MANLETPFQRELVRCMTDVGMHAFKASHKDMIGVPDLSIQSEEGYLWMECKFFTAELTFQRRTVRLTTPQHSFLQRHMDAGGKNGVCGVAVGYLLRTNGHDAHGLFLCSPKNQDVVIKKAWMDDLSHPSHIRRVRGSPWPAKLIVSRVNLMYAGMLPWADQERGK